MPNLFNDDPVIPKIAFFDFETNGFHPSSVLEVYIKKCLYEDGIFSTVATFHRYYFPEEPINPHALRVHGLDERRLALLRDNCTYSRYFREDPDFNQFTTDITHWVAHNIQFDAAFLPCKVQKEFCTMKSNTSTVKILRNGSYKFPTLAETARFYGIPFDAESAHGAAYDTEVLFTIFLAMHSAKDAAVARFLKDLR